MATTNAAIEKIVRKVLDEELAERNEATLEAIERLGRVLTEEVIPRLRDADQGDTEDQTEAELSGDGGARAMRRSDVTLDAEDGEESEDDIGIPEDENESEVPAAVLEAFEALYQSLSAEQANALEALFAAIAREPADEAEEPEEQEEPEESEEPDVLPPETPPHKPSRPKAQLAS